MFVSRYMPCEYCGESLDRTAPGRHQCSPERLTDFQMVTLRGGVAAFEDRFRTYVDSPLGRFEVWSAAQQVRGSG